MSKRIVIVMLSSVAMFNVQAAEWALSGNVNSSLEYDDNIFMRNENKLGDYHASMSPTLKVAHALENFESSLSTGYVSDRYETSSQLDTDNPFLRFETDYKTERSIWGLDLSYVESSSRSEAEEDSGDFETNSTSTTESISPSYSFQLSERDVLLINASYSTKEYSTTDFSDSRLRSLSTNWQHQFTERFNGGVSLSVSNNKSIGLFSTTDDDTYNVSLTTKYDLSEIWAINGSVGIRQLNSEQTDLFGYTEDSSDAGPSLDMSVNYKGELNNVDVNLSSSISPSSTGGVTEQDRFSLNWSRELSETITARISTSYQKTTSTINSNDERENISFSPSVNWKFSRDASLGLSYRFRQQKEELDDSDASSQTVMLTLNYNWDGFRVSR
ncbi:hypothetical protein [uncultured Cycloclasticus sp.]|uniref:hypothetical protein n=1 Tax=uncultured Cycloclasticus sp. TaxID=172194 RepID=UPI0025904A21|nr:hypothetical protein [uncultured Cycloclasticus sp.]